MSEIPEDIDLKATAIVRADYSGPDSDPEWEIYKAIAHAILAERERCAKVAEAYRDPDQYFPDQIVTANLIAAAIRKETE